MHWEQLHSRQEVIERDIESVKEEITEELRTHRDAIMECLIENDVMGKHETVGG